jgi:aspartate aminotransferase-like enzyme
MPDLLPNVDPDGLLEYSVVFTDRSLNHMSKKFQTVMRDISNTLKQTYNADAVVVVPGGGSYGMEAVARQFANNKRCMVIRNGWFSYRWTQIFEAGQIPSSCEVFKAQRQSQDAQAAFAPAPIEAVKDSILHTKPDLVFAPHVETASGMLLPDDYIKSVAESIHSVGGLFVLDCVASGALWVDMKALGVDILISAPQKGWSSSPCAALIMLNDKALSRMEETTSTSFACDLKKWLQIMQAYENGGHAYHATMPTDALVVFRDNMKETQSIGFEKLKAAQIELGTKVRQLFASKGVKSVAAEGFQSPTVVVNYTTKDSIQNTQDFVAKGIQAAAGVPLQCDEPDDFKTFRIGLFGLDKLKNIDRTINILKNAIDNMQFD